MRLTRRNIRTMIIVAIFGAAWISFVALKPGVIPRIEAQGTPAPSATPAPAFDQAAACLHARAAPQGQPFQVRHGLPL